MKIKSTNKKTFRNTWTMITAVTLAWTLSELPGKAALVIPLEGSEVVSSLADPPISAELTLLDPVGVGDGATPSAVAAADSLFAPVSTPSVGSADLLIGQGRHGSIAAVGFAGHPLISAADQSDCGDRFQAAEMYCFWRDTGFLLPRALGYLAPEQLPAAALQLFACAPFGVMNCTLHNLND